jgi:hypothetical protein
MIGNKGKKKKKGEDRNIEDEEAQRHAICKPEKHFRQQKG